MADYHNKGRFGDRRPSFGSKRPTGGFRGNTERSFDRKELYDAECASCHKMTQVPFRPNGKKPVYCKDCFQQDGGRADSFRPQQRREFAPRASAPAPDARIGDIQRQLERMQDSIEALTAEVQKLSRGTAIGAEIRKVLPAAKKAASKKAAPKKAARKTAKK